MHVQIFRQLTHDHSGYEMLALPAKVMTKPPYLPKFLHRFPVIFRSCAE